MGKGKKKDKTKKETQVPSLESLSLREAPPPQAPPSEEPEEDSGGLTGGGRKMKPNKKTSEQQAGPSTSVEEVGASSSQVTVSSDDRKQMQKDNEVEEEEGLGLGLGGGKKNRRKKKKPDVATAQAAQSQSAQSQPVPSQARPTQTGPPQTGPPQTAPPQTAPPQTALPQTVPPQVRPLQSEPSHVAPQATGHPARAPWASEQVAARPSQDIRGTGKGRGRGSGAPQTMPQTGWQAASNVQQPGLAPSWTTQQRPQEPQQSQYQQQRPQESQQRAPQASQDPRGPSQVSRGMGRGQAPAGKPAESGSAVCRFTIPAKIIGRPVLSRPVRVVANYLMLKIKGIKIYRYDVIFKPDRPKKLMPVAYNLLLKQHFNKICIGFDQRKNLYALNQLPGIAVTGEERKKFLVTVKDSNDKDYPVEISLKFTGIVDLGTILAYMSDPNGTSLNPPTEAIQAIDVILRHGTLESYVKAGRQFFKRPERPIDLGDGLEMWTGLFQSAIFTSSPYINIDVAHKGFPKHQMLVDTYTKDFRLDTARSLYEQRGGNVEAFEQFIKGLRVIAYIGGDIQKGPQREFIVNGIVDPPNKLSFRINEGTPKEATMTVANYFEREKKCRIRFPNLNCVWVGPKEKKIYYPMEFLLVVYGQVLNKQLNEKQLSTLVRESATPPWDRKKKIEEVIKDMNYSGNPYFKNFGLDIGNQFLQIDAKVLAPPKIEVGGMSMEPRNGVWQARKLLKPQSLDSWAFICIETDSRNKFDRCIELIIKIGREMGMNVTNPKFVQFSVRLHEVMQTLQLFREKGVTFVFVVLSFRGRDYYHKLKRTAEREVGVLTQCIKENTATNKMNDPTVRNIMLKVNSKLMGINHALEVRSVPQCLQGGNVMLVGADVTHPSPDQTSVPSIAAVTASIDAKHAIYNITLSVQTPKKEMIVDFEEMMLEHLNEYEKRQRDLPAKIFVFRDGVSEGQFAQVMNSELQAVLNAYRRKSPKRPEVLFLLVQKRHHTRLFTADRNANVEAGTVVDKLIVHPRELDFYLVSHQAIKGTARPTRYHAVCNDGRISQDEVEQLTYYLCHLYARCQRSVSYPTPTYYAHLACMRARSLTFGERFSNDELERKPQRLRVLERMLQNSRMFFV